MVEQVQLIGLQQNYWMQTKNLALCELGSVFKSHVFNICQYLWEEIHVAVRPFLSSTSAPFLDLHEILVLREARQISPVKNESCS